MTDATKIDDEMTDWTSAFKGIFGSAERVADRVGHERNAGLLPEKRRAGRRPQKSLQINFRATPSTKSLLDTLAENLGLSVGDVLENAIRQMAREKGVRA